MWFIICDNFLHGLGQIGQNWLACTWAKKTTSTWASWVCSNYSCKNSLRYIWAKFVFKTNIFVILLVPCHTPRHVSCQIPRHSSSSHLMYYDKYSDKYHGHNLVTNVQIVTKINDNWVCQSQKGDYDPPSMTTPIQSQKGYNDKKKAVIVTICQSQKA